MRECDYCLIHRDHGGKCEGNYNSKPCLHFERDPLGCRRYLDNQKLLVPFTLEIPHINESCGYWLLNGVDKTITITKIKAAQWWRNKNGGLEGLALWTDYWYWSDENGELPPEKPRLKLIKK